MLAAAADNLAAFGVDNVQLAEGELARALNTATDSGAVVVFGCLAPTNRSSVRACL
jgi:precorrin-6B methylase 2